MSYNIPNIDGWMSDIEMQYLYTISQQMDSIVELGCWKGRSTHAIASGCSGKVYCVDHFKGSKDDPAGLTEIAKQQDIYSIFLENTKQFNNIAVLKMSTDEAFAQFENKSVDMVFIDAGHNYPDISTDIKNWLPKARKLICGHDFWHDPIMIAVSEQLGYPKEIIGSIWIKYIK